MTTQRSPLVLLPDAESVDTAAVALRRKGHATHAGFDLPEPFDARDRKVLCAGSVTDEATARAAVLAAARGAGLLVAIAPHLDADVSDRFLTDLTRLGPVQDRLAPADTSLPALTAEQHQLVDLLADGASIPQAAAELYISVRTAERRMAQVRAALGVRTTAAAIVAVRESMAGSGDTARDAAPYRPHEEVAR